MKTLSKSFNICIAWLTIILVGCQSSPTPIDLLNDQNSDSFVMKDVHNQECRYRQSFSDKYKGLGIRQYEVFCGRWEYPSGHIFEMPVNQEEQIPLQQLAESGVWKDWLNKQMICKPGKKDVVMGDLTILGISCKLLNGNWTYLALIAQVGDSIYLADGIPSIKAVLENFIGNISGRIELPTVMNEDTRNKALQKIRDLVKGPVYSSRELMEYFRLMATGQFYNSIKDYRTSALRYQSALDLHTQIFGDNNLDAVDPLMHLALELSNGGNFKKAEFLFERAKILAFKSPDRSDLARYLSYKALHAANTKQFSQALEFAQKATAIRKKLASHYQQADTQIDFNKVTRVDFSVFANIETPNLVDIVQSLYIEASMLERLGNYKQAEKITREAKSILQLTREVPPSWEPEFEGLLARIAKAKGAEGERSKHLRISTDLWENFAPGERPSAINFLKLGEVYRAQNRNNVAMRAFRRAVEIVRTRNGSFSYDQLLPYFETALELAAKNPKKTKKLNAEIFTAGQLIKSKLTTQNIAMAVARLAADEDNASTVIRDFQDAQDKRFLLQNSYEAKFSKLSGKGRLEQLKNIKLKLSKVDQQLAQLSIQVQSAFPRYNLLVDSAIDAKQVMKLIKHDEALVQILLGVDNGMLFVVSNEKVTATRIDISFKGAQELIDNLRSGLTVNKRGQLERFDVNSAHSLYQRLFNSVKEEISGKHLITVVSGAFLSLPLGVLVTEIPEFNSDHNYRSIKWLAKSNPVSLFPSVRSFVGLRDKMKSSMVAEKSFIGFADFIPMNKYSIDQLNLQKPNNCQINAEKTISYQQIRSLFSPLPATKIEVAQVAKVFPKNTVDLSFDSAFTDRMIKDMPLHQYQVLYFATHGLLPNELDCHSQPSLVTSSPAILKGKDDGFLDMEEILKLRLNADLVVLSACNTGGADKKGGENLSGLARAFFFSGARALIVSHWYAADQASVYLMTDLFNKLREDPEIGFAKALQKVQARFINKLVDVNRELEPKSNKRNKPYDFSHPFYWALYSVVGDGEKRLNLK